MTSAPTAPAPVSLGGYRLVRTLGTGPRATVYLGHADGHPATAVKVFAASVPVKRIEREAAVLLRAAGDHVVRLTDLTLDACGRPAFLLERIAGPTLGTLLDRRRTIRPGEAVTILAPLAAALARMHRDGVVHGGVDTASVLFTDAGSPTLVGFGDAELLDLAATGREAVAARSRMLARDHDALRRLACTVLEATAPHPSAGAGSTSSLRVLGDDGLDGYAARLADAVFDLAEPEPLDLDAPASAISGVPGRTAGGSGGSANAAPSRKPGGGLALHALQVPEWLLGVAGVRGGSALGRARSAAASVRAPFRIAGGAAAASLTAALVLVPAGAQRPEGTARGLEGAAQRSEGATQDQEGTAGAPGPAGDSSARGPHEIAPVGDDPAAAAVKLLALRAECFRDLSVLCLDGVHQPDSAASFDDAEAILAAQEHGGTDADGVVLDGAAETVERLGDTALVRIVPPDAEPASVLLVRTEAGWRIRGFPGAARGAAGAD